LYSPLDGGGAVQEADARVYERCGRANTARDAARLKLQLKIERKRLSRAYRELKTLKKLLAKRRGLKK
jgi:hypothetical protein